MSIASRLRNPKAPSPNRDLPRKLAKDWAPPPFNATDFADKAHRANKRTLVPRGAFGGKLRSKRPVEKV